MGIEPTSEAWEASILPLYDARSLFLIVLRNWFSVQRSSDSATISAGAGEVRGAYLGRLQLFLATQGVAGSTPVVLARSHMLVGAPAMGTHNSTPTTPSITSNH
jgi:hypothetical protein